MTTEEIIAGNKLIAEFLGWELTPRTLENGWKFIWWERDDETRSNPKGRRQLCYDTSLQYHSSWDWLMPVVEQFENDLNMVVVILNKSCSIIPQGKTQSKSITKGYLTGETKIEGVWKAVVEFIKWYNSNKL